MAESAKIERCVSPAPRDAIMIPYQGVEPRENPELQLPLEVLAQLALFEQEAAASYPGSVGLETSSAGRYSTTNLPLMFGCIRQA
jgi:hypothetical protein